MEFLQRLWNSRNSYNSSICIVNVILYGFPGVQQLLSAVALSLWRRSIVLFTNMLMTGCVVDLWAGEGRQRSACGRGTMVGSPWGLDSLDRE